MVDKTKLIALQQYMIAADAEYGIPAVSLLGHLVREFGADVVKELVDTLVLDQNPKYQDGEADTICLICGRALRVCQWVGGVRIKYCTNLDKPKIVSTVPLTG